MQKAFLVALSLALPAFAAPGFDSDAMDVDPEELVSQEASDEAGRGGPVLLPYCWDISYTTCTSRGATQQCTDGIWTDYVCTCRAFGSRNVWDCPEVR